MFTSSYCRSGQQESLMRLLLNTPNTQTHLLRKILEQLALIDLSRRGGDAAVATLADTQVLMINLLVMNLVCWSRWPNHFTKLFVNLSPLLGF